MNIYIDILVVTVLGGFVSIFGALLLVANKKSARLLATYSTPFAAGGLLAAVFIDLLPEGLVSARISTVLTSTMIGLLVFFYLERILRWFHCHHNHLHDEAEVHKNSSRTLIVTGNALHNSLDGVAIASAFLVNIPVGIVTAIAVSAHEVPRNIGDIGLLLARGMGRKLAIIIHIICTFATVPVALVVYRLGGSGQLPIGVLLGISAGFMLYVAASDIIPAINKEVPDNKILDIRPLLLLAGVLTVSLAIKIAEKFA